MELTTDDIFFDGSAAYHSGKSGYELYEAMAEYHGIDAFAFMDGYMSAKLDSEKRRKVQ